MIKKIIFGLLLVLGLSVQGQSKKVQPSYETKVKNYVLWFTAPFSFILFFIFYLSVYLFHYLFISLYANGFIHSLFPLFIVLFINCFIY